jgi:hypothetical protein
MANRFAWGDTLGAQLYGRSLQSLAAERERQRLLEEERQRREAERRRQEEQRRKASDHGAFGQTLQTIGQVGGAIIGAKYGGAEGAVIGSNLGSAGASTIMNLFPNVGGTEPDGSNPYYDKPSDMAKFSSTLNTGLQAYGAYSKAAAAEEQKKFTQKVTADIADQTKRFREGDTSAFNYYGATPTEIQKHIETKISGWDDAKGFFGDKLLNSDVSLSMANTIHQNMMSRLGQQMQFANSLTDTTQKQQVFTNLEGLYGQNYSDFIPEGGSDAIRAGIQQNIEKTTQGAIKDANARAVQLFETNYNIAKLGQKKTIDPINVEGADPQLQSSLNRLVTATNEATIAGNTKAANDELKKNAASALQDVTTALGKTEQGSQAQQALSSLATGLAQQAYGLDPEITSVIYSNFAKDVKPPQDDLLKTAQEIARRQFLELTKRDGEQYTPEQVAKLHIKNDPTLRSPVTLEILRLASGAKDNQELIAYAESLKDVEVDEAKQKSWYERWGIFNYIFGGSESDVSETQLNNNASANGNPDLLNRIFSNLPSLNGR